MKAQPNTLADLRAKHDKNVVIPNKITKALAEMAKLHPEHWVYEVDFLKLADVSTTDLAMFRPKFEDHWADVASTHSKSARRIWFGAAKACATWKKL